MSRWADAIALAALASLSAGCAAIQKDAGFQDVRSAVQQRSGFLAHWDQQPAGEVPVGERIRALLKDDLTEPSAVEIALLNNRRLQASFEELGIAQADLLEGHLIRNPALEAELRFPRRPFELILTQNILDLATLRRRRRLADAAFEAAKLRVADEVMRLIADVRASYYALQGAEQMKAMRQTVVEAARAAAELAIRQHDAGNISDLALENEQAVFEQAKIDLARSEGDVLAGRARLSELLGLWGPETEWKITLALQNLPPAETDLAGLESLAVSQRLDLGTARQQVEVAARALPLAPSKEIGEFVAGAHLEREPEGLRTNGPAVELPLPLFKRGKAARLRAEALLRQAQHRYAALAVEVRTQVGMARDRMLLARSRAEYYRDVILPRRERIVAFSQQHYNFMLVGTFQLLMAKRDEITARREYIEALTDYWIARSDLEHAVGGSLSSAAPHSVTGQPES